jgi:ABC-2 type transport system permease protein
MSNALTLARREFTTYFHSPVAYIVLGVFLVAATSLYYFIMAGGAFVVGKASMRTFFAIMPWLFMVLAPAVTMRLLAEERRTGTLEVLMTLPVTERDVVIGKFRGALAMVALGVSFTLPIPFTMAGLVADGFAFDWGPVLGGYLGTLLLVSGFLAIGMWASAATRNQIVAFVVALAISFLLVIVDNVAFFMPTSIGPVFQYLSVSQHFDNIARGVIDSRDVVFYLSMTAVGLRLTVGSLKNARA